MKRCEMSDNIRIPFTGISLMCICTNCDAFCYFTACECYYDLVIQMSCIADLGLSCFIFCSSMRFGKFLLAHARSNVKIIE
jgi:hypothetical protein